MSRGLRVGMDVDGVLADFVAHTVRCLRSSGVKSPPVDAFTTYDLTACVDPATATAMQQMWRVPGWCETMPVYAGAQGFVDNIQHALGAEVVYITKPLSNGPYWTFERTKWLARHFGARPDDIVYTGRKELVDVDVLIEDNDETAARFEQAWSGRQSFVIKRPYNEGGWGYASVVQAMAPLLHGHCFPVLPGR